MKVYSISPGDVDVHFGVAFSLLVSISNKRYIFSAERCSASDNVFYRAPLLFHGPD